MSQIEKTNIHVNKLAILMKEMKFDDVKGIILGSPIPELPKGKLFNILNLLRNSGLDQGLKELNPKEELSVYLRKLIIEKDFESIEIIKNSYIEKSYFYKILRGEANPSRDKVLQIALSMKLDKEEALKLLSVAGYGLSPQVKRDYIILYCMDEKLDPFITNDILEIYEVSPLII